MSSKILGLIFLCSMTVVFARRNKTKVANNISFSIIPMTGFEKYYEDVTLLNLDNKLALKPSEEKVDKKKNICSAIFSNAVMQKLTGVHPSDPLEKEFQEELQEKYPQIYERFYRQGPPDDRPLFENRFQKLPISLGHVTVEEFVFTCFVRNPTSKNIEEYFVSREYHHPHNEFPDSRQGLVSVRFVFQRNERNDLVLLALAESTIETVFPLNPRYCIHPDLSTNGRSKELCENLPAVQRIRLCGILLNGKSYRELTRYEKTDTMDLECKETELTVVCNTTDVRITDFAVQCKADGIQPGSSGSVIRYISRGIKAHQFFISQPMENSTGLTVSTVFYSYLVKLEPPSSTD